MFKLPVQNDEIAFWHPVGPHCGESLDEIIKRKQGEIAQYGFTLWSFDVARKERVISWRYELFSRRQQNCWVLCCGAVCRDPYKDGSPVIWATESSEDYCTWKSLPSQHMTSYHKIRRSDGIIASAFIVTRLEISPPGVRLCRPMSWFRSVNQSWENGVAVPTRGQYLVQCPQIEDGVQNLRILLETKFPFVVWTR